MTTYEQFLKNMKMNKKIVKTLRLPLTCNWFEMTKSGIKPEDYREITPYWFKRLVFDYKKVFKYCTGYDWDNKLYRKEGVKHICYPKKHRHRTNNKLRTQRN